uniref:Aldose 1-epimerase n=1 Tax=Cacopsylla melanoneura TaxID=428564 RepID=A0A8D8WSP6_9HEMI
MDEGQDIRDVIVMEDKFGECINEETGQVTPVRRLTLTNSQRMSVQVIDYGATITTIKVPDKRGNVDDVVLGFDDMKGYLDSKNPYFGSTVGRVANRIAGGKFTISNQEHKISQNVDVNHLHGGFKGFDKVMWSTDVQGAKVVMTHMSPDGDEGYPGAVIATTTFELTADNRLFITMEAVSTKPTPVNLTNHSYFNLAGHGMGSEGAYNQIVNINADYITTMDDNLIVTGELTPVANSSYDLRIPKFLGTAIKELVEPGFDFNYCLNKSLIQPTGLTFAARAFDPESGRYMEVHTDQPGIQFYTGNYIADITGKKGASYSKHCAYCFETQNYPNAVNIANFPNSVIRPGEKYKHVVSYSFGVQQIL